MESCWPEKVKNLPRTLDRFRTAAVFFDLKYPTFLQGSIDARKWTSWASLAALASISETLEYDLEELGFLSLWRDSSERTRIQSDHTLAVLRELRNYETHIELHQRKSHLDADSSAFQESVDHDSFFFTPIDWNSFRKLRNISSGRSVVTKPVVEAFNAYAKQYSVETIVTKALEHMAEIISAFLEHAWSCERPAGP